MDPEVKQILYSNCKISLPAIILPFTAVFFTMLIARKHSFKHFFAFNRGIYFLGPVHTIQLQRQCQTKGPQWQLLDRGSQTLVFSFSGSHWWNLPSVPPPITARNCWEFFKIQKIKGFPYQLANLIYPFLTPKSDRDRNSPYNIKQTSDEKKQEYQLGNY